MVVCKFYEQGNCRYGQNCRFEHPRSQSNNRFAAFGQNTGGGFNRGGNNNDGLPYSLLKEAIEKDLTSEAPQWILSAYGPGRDAPEQLFGGNLREQSFEEMRLVHMMATASGNPQQALNQAQELYQQAQQQMKTAVGNLDGAIQFIISAEQTHPNRIDICKQGTLPGGTTGEFAVGKRAASSQQNPFSSNSNAASSNPFSSNNTNTTSAFGGGGGASTGSAFGQPAALGQRANPFGTPAFGQTSQPSQQTSAFGQPSQPTSAFGAASSSAPAFGQTSQPSSAFGQPSALGGGTSAFGQASALGQKPNPFGAPAFGQPAQPAAATGGSAFGQPSQLGGGGSAFGQASALGQKPNPFGGATSGASPFASAGGSSNTPSPFGQASQNTASPSPFGQPAQNTTQNANPFGAPAQANPSPFGQPAQPATTGAFGQPAQTASSNPFGQPSQAQPAASNPFGAKSDAQPSAFGQPAANAQPAQPTQPASGFRQPAQLGQKTNHFGQNNASPFSQPSGGFGAGGSAPNPFGGQTAAPAAPAAQQAAAPGSGPYPPGSSRQHPPVSSYSSKDMNGRLSNWKGKPVTYQNNLPGIRAFNGAWSRIWFPDGPPNYYKDTELPDESYDDKSKQQWQAFTQTGKFEGLMPELPPKREFCLWDL